MTSGMSGILLGLVLGWLSLALLFLVLRAGYGWWHRRRYGVAIEHSALLAAYGRRLTNAADRVTLARLLTQEVPAELQVEQSALLLPEAYRLVTVDQVGLSLPINHAAVRWVASSGESQRADTGRLRALIEQGRTDLTWTRVWTPLMRGVNLEGLWLLGARGADARYSPEDLQWLTSLARQAAAVLEALHFAAQERQSASEIRVLYRQMVAAREVERGRLSRELHDGVLQDLCAIARDLKALNKDSDLVDGRYAHLVDLSGTTVGAMRAICDDLRPPLLQQDLVSALRALVEEIDARSDAPVHIEITTQGDELRMSDERALAIFRITQEALNNALQHADASEIAVRLTEYPDKLRLTITDDGQGMPESFESGNLVAAGHYGIAGMRERAAMIGGKLDVQTSLGYGTIVILELPC